MKIFIVTLKPELGADHATFEMTGSLRMLLPPNTNLVLSEWGFATRCFMANRKKCRVWIEELLWVLFAIRLHLFILAFSERMRYKGFSENHTLCCLTCKMFPSWLCFCHPCKISSRLGEVIVSFLTRDSGGEM